jgi:hypothetical protein
MAVDDFFHEHTLFRYLDYEIAGHVLNGVIYVRVTCKTKKAKQLSTELPELAISVGRATLHTALVQIFAEKEHTLGVSGGDVADWNAVRRELSEIDEQPWQDIDNVNILNPEDMQMMPGSLYIPQEKEPMPARKILVALLIDEAFAESHKELLPLYWQLAILISESTKVHLYATFGFYSKGVMRQAAKLTYQYYIPYAYPLELSRMREVIESSLLDLHKNKAFKRLGIELRSAKYNDPDRPIPGPHYMYERTGLIVGTKGWQRIATDDNCALVLSHMKFVVRTGHKRVSSKISSIFDGAN